MKVLITTDMYTANVNGVVTSVRNLMEELEEMAVHSKGIAAMYDKGHFAEQIEDVYEKVTSE